MAVSSYIYSISSSKESHPFPPVIDPVTRNRVYNAADTKLYNRGGRFAAMSERARVTGQTRVLALGMLAQKPPSGPAGAVTDAKAGFAGRKRRKRREKTARTKRR
jgi:hypothetical protein